jgi:hypothetical protein
MRRQQCIVLCLLSLVGVDDVRAADVGTVGLVAGAQRHNDHPCSSNTAAWTGGLTISMKHHHDTEQAASQ